MTPTERITSWAKGLSVDRQADTIAQHPRKANQARVTDPTIGPYLDRIVDAIQVADAQSCVDHDPRLSAFFLLDHIQSDFKIIIVKGELIKDFIRPMALRHP